MLQNLYKHESTSREELYKATVETFSKTLHILYQLFRVTEADERRCDLLAKEFEELKKKQPKAMVEE